MSGETDVTVWMSGETDVTVWMSGETGITGGMSGETGVTVWMSGETAECEVESPLGGCHRRASRRGGGAAAAAKLDGGEAESKCSLGASRSRLLALTATSPVGELLADDCNWSG